MNRRLRGAIAAVESGDRWLLLAVGVLLFLGIIVVYGAGSYNNPGGGSLLGAHFLIAKHLFMIGVGLLLMVLLSNVNYNLLLLRNRWFNWGAVLVGLVLMVMTLLQGKDGEINRWVTIGGFRFQPVEMVKLALILFLAERWARPVYLGKLPWRQVLLALLLGPVPLFVILFKQPNFGNLLTMGVVILAMLLVSGLTWPRLALAVGVPVTAAVGAFLISTKLQTRLAEWTNGLQGESFGFQVDRSLMGMGAGGLLGLGPGNGHNKYAFLPEAHTDFIYSVLGEELGLWGTLLVILALVTLVWRGYGIAARAVEPFGRLVATGLTTSIAVYGLVNIAMVTGAFPVVGVPLPFVSFGGTAMVAALASVGILLKIDHTSTMISQQNQQVRDRRPY